MQKYHFFSGLVVLTVLAKGYRLSNLRYMNTSIVMELIAMRFNCLFNSPYFLDFGYHSNDILMIENCDNTDNYIVDLVSAGMYHLVIWISLIRKVRNSENLTLAKTVLLKTCTS